MTPELPFEHFALQSKYAQRAVEISSLPQDQALMDFTQFWRRIHNPLELKTKKMEWSFDSTTAEWEELTSRIHNGEAPDKVAFDLYMQSNKDTEEGTGKKYFGCFRYDFNAKFNEDIGVIKIHFINRDDSGHGPLSKVRQSTRTEDLRKMFTFIQESHPEAQVVHGGSWLYNIESYKRLFPKTFTSNMRVETVPFPRTSGIWGQFLDSEGNVKKEMADNLLYRASKAETVEDLLQIFEFKILYPRAKIEDFYNHLEIT